MTDVTSNVVTFPAREVRDWTTMNRTVRAILSEGGHNNDTIEFVLARFHFSWKKLDLPGLDLTIPAACAPLLEEVTTFLRQPANILMLELVNAYIEIANLQPA